MALFDNIINKYFKTPDPEEPPVETTAESSTTEQSGGTINPYSQVGGGKVDDGNLRFSMPQTQPDPEESPADDLSVSTKDKAETTAESNATEQSGSSGAGAYEQMWEKLHDGVEGEPESQEDIEEREKREKRNSNISALADALGGVANIWGSIKGATPMDISSLSEANKRRYDYAKERRERNQEAWRRGMFNARANDMNLYAQEQQAKQKAEANAAAQKYKKEQDKIKQEQWQTKYDFDTEQAKQKAELDRQKFEETQRRNEADLKIRQRTVALAEKKANTELNNSLNNASGKVTRFGLSDGSNITVPDDLRGSYVADVYNKLVNAAGDATIDRNGNTKNPILSFMKFQYGQKEPGLSEMMTAIQLYKDEYLGIEDYMVNRANEYTENYNTPVEAKDLSAPGSPGESTVPLIENKEAPKSGAKVGGVEKNTPLTDDDLLEYLLE